MTGPELALAARALVGTPFRLHGRDPGTGLDCVGVLEAASRACGLTARLPGRYALRSRRRPQTAAIAMRLGLEETGRPIEPGDVIMLRPGPCQHHFGIATAPGCFIHAHAGLRRVVEGPIPCAWPRIGHWRPNPLRN